MGNWGLRQNRAKDVREHPTSVLHPGQQESKQSITVTYSSQCIQPL